MQQRRASRLRRAFVAGVVALCLLPAAVVVGALSALGAGFCQDSSDDCPSVDSTIRAWRIGFGLLALVPIAVAVCLGRELRRAGPPLAARAGAPGALTAIASLVLALAALAGGTANALSPSGNAAVALLVVVPCGGLAVLLGLWTLVEARSWPPAPGARSLAHAAGAAAAFALLLTIVV